MVIGTEKIDVARGLTRSAAVDLASGASDLTRAEDAFIVAERLADLGGVVAEAGVVDVHKVLSYGNHKTWLPSVQWSA